MKILLLTNGASKTEWDTKLIELHRLPTEGAFINEGHGYGSEWYQVLLVGDVPCGANFEAKLICRRMNESDVREIAYHGLSGTLPVVSTPRPEPELQLPYQTKAPPVGLLSEKEAAAAARVSKWTIRRLVEKGQLPAANYGMRCKRYRIHPDDLAKVNPYIVLPREPRRKRERRKPVTEDWESILKMR